MAERNLSVDHVTIWRWVQRYAPVLNQRIRREMRPPNRSWRVDETYVKVAGKWAYLYRAVDSAGETIEFMLSPIAIWSRRSCPAPGIIRRGTHAACDQRGWPPGICQRNRRVEADRRTRPTMSLPNCAVPEQHHRARPSLHQEADHGEPRFSVRKLCRGATFRASIYLNRRIACELAELRDVQLSVGFLWRRSTTITSTGTLRDSSLRPTF